VRLQTGDTVDIRVKTAEFDCLVEVAHKSVTHPFSEVFDPDPADFVRYSNGPEWKRAAVRL
jgi:hypothetical protein